MTAARPTQLAWALLRASLAVDFEYRGAFWGNALLSAFWLAWATQAVHVYFRFSSAINGWTYTNLLVLMGVFFLMNGIRQTFFAPNLLRMGEYVRDGTLDEILLKPVDSQLLVSVRNVDVTHVPDIVLGAALAGYGATQAHGLTPRNAVLAALLVCAATVILYALSFITQVAALVLVKADSLEQLMYAVLETTRFPPSVYGGVLGFALTVIVPVAFVVTTPAAAVVGRAGWPSIGEAALVGLLLLAAGRILWLRALRSYTGASA
jgi:ABC-2 type transport system permease protein